MARQSLLWTIQKNKGETSFLFGTMHVRDDRAHQLSKQLYPLILASDRFIAEMDLEMQQGSIQMPQYNIHDHIPDKKFTRLRDQIVKSFGIDLNEYTHLHPLIIMSMLSTSVLQSEHHVSLDEHLWQFAKENDKPVSGLESYEEQMNILFSIDVDTLYKQLIHTGRNPGSLRKNSGKGLDLYLSGDIHKLYKQSKSSLMHLRKKVIYDRNVRMVSVIDHLDYSMKYFITAGAGHLSGKFGLISLLKKAGWIVKPISMKNF